MIVPVLKKFEKLFQAFCFVGFNFDKFVTRESFNWFGKN